MGEDLENLNEILLPDTFIQLLHHMYLLVDEQISEGNPSLAAGYQEGDAAGDSPDHSHPTSPVTDV